MSKFTDNEEVHYPDDEARFPYRVPGGTAAASMKVIKSSLNEYGIPVVMVEDADGSLSTYWEADLKPGKRVIAAGRVFLPEPTEQEREQKREADKIAHDVVEAKANLVEAKANLAKAKAAAAAITTTAIRAV